MAISVTRAFSRSDKPTHLVVIFNEPVLQVNSINENDSLHTDSYSLSEGIRVYSVQSLGTSAILLTVDPLELGTSYALNIVNVTALNGDRFPGPNQTIYSVSISSDESLSQPTVILEEVII